MTSASKESRFIKVEGLNIHVVSQGEGPAALLLHGWPTSSTLWRHTMDALSQSNRVVAPDLPGFGKSDKPLDVSYSFRFYERVIDGLVEQLSLAPVHFVVHDLGGPVGLYWAVRQAEKLRSLTLLNTTVFPFDSWAVKGFLLSTYLPGIKRFLTSQRGLSFAMNFGLSHRGPLTREELTPYLQPFVRKSSRKALLKTAQNLHRNGFREIVEGLQKLPCPIRLIYAEKDRILPDVAKEMERLHQMLPGPPRLSKIPGTGHFLQEDNPEPLCALLTEFWQEVEQTSSSPTTKPT